MNAIQNGTKTAINDYVFFGVACVAGIFALGCILGFVIAAVILSFANNGTIAAGAGRVVFIVLFAVVFGALMLAFQAWLYIIATAIPGAYAVVLGIDCFANIGFKDAALSFLGKGSFQTSAKLWGLIALFFILAVFGLAVQTMLYYRKKHRRQAQEAAKSDTENAVLLENAQEPGKVFVVGDDSKPSEAG
ncbi:hypothetical protein HDU96_005083, partial [Phlyctochytrium bullatum]